MSDMPTDLMERYAGVSQYDWAARALDEEAHKAFETGDGFDRLQNARRLMISRHLAATIISRAREDALEEAAAYHDSQAEKFANLSKDRAYNPELSDKLASDCIKHQGYAMAIRALKDKEVADVR